ncbi:hypothetical protein [Variovorax sp. dw_954]|uniref:hypothetical protein n=1 Tax=Variovorax sp. dw_954 TaxID=2720078 RepID=UPI001BD3A9C8|nr:hypothetical protein [Variovorax sp. dw_954]
MHELLEPFVRTWADITNGSHRHVPLAFRFILQPCVAAFFAWRAGRQDAREGRPLYFWGLLTDSAHRPDALREGWKHIGKVFSLAIVMDCVYQLIELRWIYIGEALMIATLLAVLPYLVVRGLVHRVLRSRK